MTNDIKFELKSAAEAEQLGFISIKKADSLTTKSQSKITRLCRENYGNPEKAIAKVLNDKGLYSYYIKREYFEKKFKDFLIVNSELGRGIENINKETTTADNQKKADLNERDHEETHASAIIKRAYKDELAIVRKENEKKIEALKKEHSSLYRKTVISLIVAFVIIIITVTAYFIYQGIETNKNYRKSQQELISISEKNIAEKKDTIDNLNNHIEKLRLKENDYIQKLTELSRDAGKNEAVIKFKEEQLNEYKSQIVELKYKIEKLQNSDTEKENMIEKESGI